MSNIIPSPLPPWHRPITSPNTETFTEDNDGGTLSLTADVSYLNTIVAKDADADYEAVLPDGNYQRQIKRIFIPKAIESTTKTWSVSGTFVGFATLKFDTTGRSAVLEWDGTGWHLIGGNAQPLD